MTKQCVLIDAYSWNDYHEVINVGYLLMLMQIYHDITYVADTGACDNIQSQLQAFGKSTDNIHFVRKSFSKPSNGIRKFLRLFRVSWDNYWHYMHTPSDADVFYNNNLHLGTLLIHYFSFGKRNRVFSMCHAEMEMIDKREATTMSRTAGCWMYRTAFCSTTLNRKMHFIMLSSDMADLFQSYIRKENRSQIHWIDHCYIRPQLTTSERADNSEKVRLGLPGAITPQRGLPELKKLLLSLPDEALELYAISYISEHVSHPSLTLLNDTGRLSSYQEYGNYISQMDAILLLYRKDSYRMTASGAALEAIWQGKPIISIRNGYVDYLFRRFGPLGYVYDDIEQLSQQLLHISRKDLSLFNDNLAKARESLLPTNVCQQLKKIVNETE